MEQHYRAKVNKEGRLSIHAECRKRLGITPGQELILQVDGAGLHLLTPELALKQLQDKVAAAVGPEVDLVGELIEERGRMPKTPGKVVLDASALLTVLRNEPGAERVAPHLGRSIMSAVNVAEVATILGRRGMAASSVLADVCKIVGEIRPFDMENARLSAALDEKTRSLGLSLADWACLSSPASSR
jgi:ribonuclease VapC